MLGDAVLSECDSAKFIRIVARFDRQVRVQAIYGGSGAGIGSRDRNEDKGDDVTEHVRVDGLTWLGKESS
jgi:hypothetical protein